jgi:hypothetical protein
LVSITSSSASRGRRSSTGWQKVPTPGPYSTNSRVFAQSTGASISRISTGPDCVTAPTMRGCSMKPRMKTPAGPIVRAIFCIRRGKARLRASSLPFIGMSLVPVQMQAKLVGPPLFRPELQMRTRLAIETRRIVARVR